MDSYITRPIHSSVRAKIDTLNYVVDWIFYTFFPHIASILYCT